MARFAVEVLLPADVAIGLAACGFAVVAVCTNGVTAEEALGVTAIFLVGVVISIPP